MCRQWAELRVARLREACVGPLNSKFEESPIVARHVGSDASHVADSVAVSGDTNDMSGDMALDRICRCPSFMEWFFDARPKGKKGGDLDRGVSRDEKSHV